MDSLNASLVAIVFSTLFYITSKSERCWYRREIIPLMLVILGAFTLNESSIYPAVAFTVSSLLTYYGYKGYGIQIKKKAK